MVSKKYFITFSVNQKLRWHICSSAFIYIPNIVILSQAITHCQLRFIPQKKILPFALFLCVSRTSRHYFFVQHTILKNWHSSTIIKVQKGWVQWSCKKRSSWKTGSKDELPKSSDDIDFSGTIIKELNRKQFKPSEVASNLQKVRGYVNDGTRILNGITLDQLQWLGNRVEGYFFIYGFLQSATRPIFLFSEQLHNKQW